MTAIVKPPRLFLSLSFTPDASLVSAISKLVADFCSVAMESADTAWLFYMAAHELAENATKYSTSPNVSLEVEMSEHDGKHVMKITSRNETSPERLRETARRLDAIRNAADPIALYDRLVIESAPRAGVSGLGLARIRAESDFSMDYSIEGGVLSISVHAPVQIKEEA